jgi:NADH-quinone oxidoreductase subunit C
MTEPTPPGTVEPAGRPDIPEVRRGMFSAGTGDTSGYGGIRRPVALPGPGAEPVPEGYREVVDALSGLIDAVIVYRGEVTFRVPREHLLQVAQTLRDDPALRFELCLGTSGVHWPQDDGAELRAVTHLRSITHRRRLRLETSCPDADPHLPSLFSVYPTVDWHERETYDFFGIVFDGHPSLTRIEMPDDWAGHPQRKDYPLGGIGVQFLGAETASPETRRHYP